MMVHVSRETCGSKYRHKGISKRIVSDLFDPGTPTVGFHPYRFLALSNNTKAVKRFCKSPDLFQSRGTVFETVCFR